MKISVIKAAAVAVFALFGSTGAFAQATQQINVGANVNLTCAVTAGGATVAADTATFATTGRVVSTSTVNPAAAGASGYDLACNGSSVDMSVTTANGGVQNQTPVLGFVNIIKYKVDVGFGATKLSYTTTGSGATSTVTNASGASGKLTVALTPLATSNLGAGTYADQLTVTLLPQ